MRANVLFSLCVVLAALSAQVHAGERETFLQKIYLSFCVKHLESFAGLREQLVAQELPRLPAQQAVNFLDGQPGDVWPIPFKGAFGQYVLALPEGDQSCHVMARGGESRVNRGWFARMAEQAPAPLIATPLEDDRVESPLTGEASRLSWQWATEHAPRRLVLSLLTAEHEAAPIQARVSLSIDDR
ncbi:hypothetical protein H9C73_03820 [Marinobacterium sp. AK62]|uniref:Uncharacterized protein n=1 Tax=Marinobacterium alkalitolerans TaxID=1542925 RepID=A0ABS3Z834_9GAMM|nr:hypothetical protein [Marinobacterium alkalitolerans]MBP0047854.1 hypothetical protein [Marinobacterium alkalitolerans]